MGSLCVFYGSVTGTASTANMQRFPAAIAWEPIGLPDNCLPLIAPHRQAFIRVGERAVSHGGLSIEELIVPFVQIERLGR